MFLNVWSVWQNTSPCHKHRNSLACVFLQRQWQIWTRNPMKNRICFHRTACAKTIRSLMSINFHDSPLPCCAAAHYVLPAQNNLQNMTLCPSQTISSLAFQLGSTNIVKYTGKWWNRNFALQLNKWKWYLQSALYARVIGEALIWYQPQVCRKFVKRFSVLMLWRMVSNSLRVGIFFSIKVQNIPKILHISVQPQSNDISVELKKTDLAILSWVQIVMSRQKSRFRVIVHLSHMPQQPAVFFSNIFISIFLLWLLCIPIQSKNPHKNVTRTLKLLQCLQVSAINVF